MTALAALWLFLTPARAAELTGLGSGTSSPKARSAAEPQPLARTAVRSKEWRMRRSPSREEEFIGGVGFSQGGTILNADWALYRHETREWRARGNVKARRRFSSGDLAEARGEEAAHDMDSQEGWLKPAPGGRVDLSYESESGDREQGSARSLAWRGKDWMLLDGAVSVRGDRLDSDSERAEIDGRSRRLALTGGRPVIRIAAPGWEGAIKADRVESSLAGWTKKSGPSELAARGTVQGWLIFEQGKRKP